MKVKLLFFASVRELLGTAGEDIDLPAGVDTVAALRQHLRQRGAAWQTAFAEGRIVRAAVNQAMAAPSTRLAPGDEIAFFPPVTGG